MSEKNQFHTIFSILTEAYPRPTTLAELVARSGQTEDQVRNSIDDVRNFGRRHPAVNEISNLRVVRVDSKTVVLKIPGDE